MLAAVLLLLVVVLIAVTAAAVIWRAQWRVAVRRRVIVQLHTGSAISGVLWSRRGPLLVLRNAALHEAGAVTPIDGEAVVERREVAWLQVLPAAEPTRTSAA